MHAGVWIKFLFGQTDAILRVAGCRASLWTGIILVLLTSIPRNYDQTLLSEEPFLWILGPLTFSFVSGSWLYGIVYLLFARRHMSAPGVPRPAADGGWRAFMALFWMTAPIAWLYAIPVERFMDSISATQANVALLSLVSLWRVVLMTRVLQVTTKAPFTIALVWVLFAASVEVLVVFFLGGGLAKSIMAAMGGMRNSPEEEIMRHAMSTAFFACLWLAPISLVVSLVWWPKQMLQPLPCPVAGPISRSALTATSCLWVAIAVIPQGELAKTVAVERLMAGGRAREALDFLATRQPDEFAPARPLPPKPFERSVFDELPECFAFLQSSDPPWVRTLMLSRLDSMMSHLRSPWRNRDAVPSKPRSEQIDNLIDGLGWHGLEPKGLLNIVDGLQRLPEGRAWLETNSIFTEALWKSATDSEGHRRRGSKTEQEQQADWLALSNRLRIQFLTNVAMTPTNIAPKTTVSPGL